MCEVEVLYSVLVLYSAVMYYSTFSPYDYRWQSFPSGKLATVGPP